MAQCPHTRDGKRCGLGPGHTIKCQFILAESPAFPKPKDQKREQPAVRIFRGGREVCNIKTKAGRDIYHSRKVAMWERQGRVCSLQLDRCIGLLHLQKKYITFEHDEGRGHGGGHRDDRIEIPDPENPGQMKPINSAACPYCNADKGSTRKSVMVAETVG